MSVFDFLHFHLAPEEGDRVKAEDFLKGLAHLLSLDYMSISRIPYTVVAYIYTVYDIYVI
jgi:hypothetical protein